MKIEPIHTKIIDFRTIKNITIIRETPDNYPIGKSNIYARNSNGQIIWYAELPIAGDTYCNPVQWNKSINDDADKWDAIYKDNSNSIVVSSWNGFTVCIDSRNGKIIHKIFTK